MKYISQKQLEDKLKPLDIKALIAKETNGRMRIRLLALLHIKEGANRAKTSIYLRRCSITLLSPISRDQNLLKIILCVAFSKPSEIIG